MITQYAAVFPILATAIAMLQQLIRAIGALMTLFWPTRQA